jgi:hypothetical protein
MKDFGRRVALVVGALAATVSLTALAAPPAQALDTGWGCGGACRIAR